MPSTTAQSRMDATLGELRYSTSSVHWLTCSTDPVLDDSTPPAVTINARVVQFHGDSRRMVLLKHVRGEMRSTHCNLDERIEVLPSASEGDVAIIGNKYVLRCCEQS